MSSWKLAKFNSLPTYPLFIHYSLLAIYMYDTAQVPEKMDSLSLSKKDIEPASKNCSHCIRVLRIDYLPLIADVFATVVRKHDRRECNHQFQK